MPLWHVDRITIISPLEGQEIFHEFHTKWYPLIIGKIISPKYKSGVYRPWLIFADYLQRPYKLKNLYVAINGYVSMPKRENSIFWYW